MNDLAPTRMLDLSSAASCEEYKDYLITLLETQGTSMDFFCNVLSEGVQIEGQISSIDIDVPDYLKQTYSTRKDLLDSIQEAITVDYALVTRVDDQVLSRPVLILFTDTHLPSSLEGYPLSASAIVGTTSHNQDRVAAKVQKNLMQGGVITSPEDLVICDVIRTNMVTYTTVDLPTDKSADNASSTHDFICIVSENEYIYSAEVQVELVRDQTRGSISNDVVMVGVSDIRQAGIQTADFIKGIARAA